MSKLRYRLLVTDLDGTLLDARQQVPPANRAALARFRQAGGRVVLATGRIEAATEVFIRELGIVEPCILYNGARIVDPVSGEALSSRQLPEHIPAQVTALLQRLNPERLHPVYYADGAPWVQSLTPVLEAYAVKDGLTLRVDKDLDVVRRAVTKILIIGPEPDLEPLHSALQRESTGVDFVRSEATYLEVLPHGCNKGAASKMVGI